MPRILSRHELVPKQSNFYNYSSKASSSSSYSGGHSSSFNKNSYYNHTNHSPTMSKYPSSDGTSSSKQREPQQKMVSNRYYEGLSYLIDDEGEDVMDTTISMFQQQSLQSRNDENNIGGSYDRRSSNVESWGYFVDFTSPQESNRKTTTFLPQQQYHSYSSSY